MSKIRVAVDAHAIGRRQTGNEVYIRSLVRRYPRLAPEIGFVGYTCCEEGDRWLPDAFERRRVASNPFLRLGRDLASKVKQDQVDLLHVQYTAPLNAPAPIVVTIHDVSYIEHPEYLPWPRAQQLRWSVRRTVASAAKVITISEFSRQAIAKAYDLDPAGIAVTPLASQDCFRPVNRETARRRVAEKLGFPQPFILNVGDLHPRKNQIGLVHAFRALLNAHPELPHMLLMVGKHTWFAPKVIEEVRKQGLEDRVVFTRFVDDDLLASIYNAADLFVFPSHYEGFGLPAIEAMACGRPVVCSDATALPEVVDGAAILFRPDSVEEQMRAMRDVLLDQELARRLEKKSLQRAKYFDWRETALRTLDVYYEVAAAGVKHPAQHKELVAR
ncbi:MAG: glycosyltransferase family 4 protein [Acidobacteria bacterium]|nr:glycosyltransferase family 4 protein [Acidobacteriota bacterium]